MKVKFLLLFVIVVYVHTYGQKLSGKCTGNCDNGSGSWVWNNGDEISGNFRDSLAIGECTFKSADGSVVYHGEFMNGLKNGNGEFTNKSFRYKGKFVNDVMRDTTAEIEFFNNKKNRKLYKGNIDGTMQGKGKLAYIGDSVYIGDFKNSLRHGEGILVDSKGNVLKKGQWVNDVFFGKQIGTLYNEPVYWDMLNKITTSKETYNIEKQKLYSLKPVIESSFTTINNKQTSYFYIKNGNSIIAVIEIIKSEINDWGGTYGRTNLDGVKTTTQIDVILNKDAILLSHLNRNQYNKPAKLPLTHLKDRWYYDDNKCLWYLFNKSSSIHHNPSGQYINIKLVRLDANKRESHETILNVSADLAKQIEDDKLPTTITGNIVKTGEYQQTFNLYHCKDFSWSRDYFKDLFSNIGDYVEGHKKFDVDLHNAGWIYYAEFSQNTYSNPTEEELSKMKEIEIAKNKITGNPIAFSCPLPSRYYQKQLEANGCGSKEFDVPEFIFKEACDLHDIDYSTKKKVVADLNFYDNMAKACTKKFGKNIVLLGSCMKIADVYFFGVHIGGQSAYNNAQHTSKLLKAAIESENGNMTVIIHESDGKTYFVSMKRKNIK
ncbi:MAG: hypothetical protein LBR81_08105 [Prevotellaceae bacterium]|jgi:hypothetical protein|nr:hypothetical protein [Prevotellaceae bacterium]